MSTARDIIRGVIVDHIQGAWNVGARPPDGANVDVVVQRSCWFRNRGWFYAQWCVAGVRWVDWRNRPHGGWVGVNAPFEYRSSKDEFGRPAPEAEADYITDIRVTHWRYPPALPDPCPMVDSG